MQGLPSNSAFLFSSGFHLEKNGPYSNNIICYLSTSKHPHLFGLSPCSLHLLEGLTVDVGVVGRHGVCNIHHTVGYGRLKDVVMMIVVGEVPTSKMLGRERRQREVTTSQMSG